MTQLGPEDLVFVAYFYILPPQARLAAAIGAMLGLGLVQYKLKKGR